MRDLPREERDDYLETTVDWFERTVCQPGGRYREPVWAELDWETGVQCPSLKLTLGYADPNEYKGFADNNLFETYQAIRLQKTTD